MDTLSPGLAIITRKAKGAVMHGHWGGTPWIYFHFCLRVCCWRLKGKKGGGSFETIREII